MIDITSMIEMINMKSLWSRFMNKKNKIATMAFSKNYKLISKGWMLNFTSILNDFITSKIK